MNVAGEGLHCTCLENASDAAGGAEGLGLPLGVNGVGGVAFGEIKLEIRHDTKFLYLDRGGKQPSWLLRVLHYKRGLLIAIRERARTDKWRRMSLSCLNAGQR